MKTNQAQTNSEYFRFLLLGAIVCMFFSISGCNVNKNLSKEIIDFGKTKSSDTVDVTSIARKYTPIGVARDNVISQFREFGFEVKEEIRGLPGCENCDKRILLANYIERPYLPFLPDKYYISIAIGFVNDKSEFISASFTKNKF